MSSSFSCASPKIDDSPPQGEWACLKMHEVMRPSFLLLLSIPLSSQLFLLTAAASSARGASRWSRLSARLSVTYNEQLADSVMNDAAEDPRLLNRQKSLADIDMMMHWMERVREKNHWGSVWWEFSLGSLRRFRKGKMLTTSICEGMHNCLEGDPIVKKQIPFFHQEN